MTLSKEEWLAWLDLPTTKWVLKALEAAAQAQQDQWSLTSWQQGQSDPLLLTELRTRADAYRAISETAYERLCELNGQDPRAD